MSGDPTDWLEMTMMLAGCQSPLSEHLRITRRICALSFGEGGSDVSLRGHQKTGGAQIITHRIVILDVISADLAGGDNWNMNWDEK